MSALMSTPNHLWVGIMNADASKIKSAFERICFTTKFIYLENKILTCLIKSAKTLFRWSNSEMQTEWVCCATGAFLLQYIARIRLLLIYFRISGKIIVISQDLRSCWLVFNTSQNVQILRRPFYSISSKIRNIFCDGVYIFLSIVPVPVHTRPLSFLTSYDTHSNADLWYVLV